MSWISEFAGKAENFLNKIDNNAGLVLNSANGKRKRATKKHQYEENTQRDDTILIEENVSYGSTPDRSAFDNAHIVNISRDEPEGDMYSLQKENEMLRNELRSLNSEMSLIMGRAKAGETDLIKLKNEITQRENEVLVLNKEISHLKSKLDKTNVHSHLETESNKKDEIIREMELRLAECQLEAQNHEKTLKNDIENLRFMLVEAQEACQTRQFEDGKELTELKLRHEELKREMDEYKSRARRSLAAKEDLIQKLKSGEAKDSETVELRALRSEIEELKKELEMKEERSKADQIRNEELQLKLENMKEKNDREMNALSERLRGESARRMAAEDNCKQKTEELHSVRDELTKEIRGLKERAKGRDEEVERLRRQLAQRGAVNAPEERRITSLTQALIQKQTALEAAVNEKNQLRLQLERAKKSPSHSTLVNRGNINDTDDAKAQIPRFLLDSPFDSGLTRRVKKAYSCINLVSVRTGTLLRRYPLAQSFTLIYAVVLHLWVLFVLLSNTPDTKI